MHEVDKYIVDDEGYAHRETRTDSDAFLCTKSDMSPEIQVIDRKHQENACGKDEPNN